MKSGSRLRDRLAGAVRPRYQRSQGDSYPEVAAGEDLLRPGAAVHHIRRLQEDRAGDRYRGGPGRRVGDDGKVGEGDGVKSGSEKNLMCLSMPFLLRKVSMVG